MRVGLQVYGCEELQLLMKEMAGRVPKQARKILDRGADKIVKEAKLNTPVDDLELEDSIRKEKSYEDRGRMRVEIVVGGTVRDVNVDNYAMLIHENYESMNPGPETIAKRAANPGRDIGSKFLERAVDDMMPKIQKQMIAAINRELAEVK